MAATVARAAGSTRFVVGITRWADTAGYRTAPVPSGPADEDVQALAARLGEVAYETRVRLAGPLPVILGSFDDVVQARELLGMLRARGHGAVAVGNDSVVASAQMHAPSRVSLRPDGMDDASSTVRYDEIVALVHAVHERVARTEETVTAKKTSLARAAMTGGLVRSKTSTRTVTESDVAREQVLYVFRRSNVQPWLLRERSIRYEGEALAPTTGENFQRLVTGLAARVPHALVDERLLRHKRRATGSRAVGGADRSRIETSNEADTDLAAHLIVVAHLQGQLSERTPY